MHVLEVRNVNDALPAGIELLTRLGVEEPSRYGDVRVMEAPVTTVYHQPQERVLFWPERDANPFFHFMEGLWMLSGSELVDFPAHYANFIRTFSDDGATLNGAYGHRWRNHWPYDQLTVLTELLIAAPNTRRAVLAMWDPDRDLFPREKNTSKDICCNTLAHFQRKYDRLDMTVFCRSNDIIWGAYGANAVHFSMLHEVMAARVGAKVGLYYQVSDNFHAYHKTLDPLTTLGAGLYRNPYGAGLVEPYPMVQIPEVWMEELGIWMSGDNGKQYPFLNTFFTHVANPLYRAFEFYKQLDNPYRFERALDNLDLCMASDWRQACVEWIERRKISQELRHAK